MFNGTFLKRGIGAIWHVDARCMTDGRSVFAFPFFGFTCVLSITTELASRVIRKPPPPMDIRLDKHETEPKSWAKEGGTRAQSPGIWERAPARAATWGPSQGSNACVGFGSRFALTTCSSSTARDGLRGELYQV